MKKLTETQIKLAEQLLLTVKNREMNVEYNELGNRISPPIFWRQVPKNIGAISELCFELGLPFLSAKVISKGKSEAGSGFYALYIEYFPEAKKLSASQVFKNECKKIRECNEWYKLADYLNINIDLPRPDKSSDSEIDIQLRILPMSNSEEEFAEMCIEEVQNEYFLGRLINEEKGLYYYRTYGINAPKGSLILFQFKNRIIAVAKLLDIKKDSQYPDYNGTFQFDINSIQVFEPITAQEINKIDSNITMFSHVKQRINSKFIKEIEELIKSKQITFIPEELPKQFYGKLKEGAKKKIIVNVYERNYKARQACIDHYGSTCAVCGFDFAKFYGEDFKGKIHVHHIKALSEINDSYEVDPINDLRPVCPNCHLVLHSKIDGEIYDIDELKEKIQIYNKR